MLKISPKIFRAYDIRGEYPSEINKKTVSEIVRRLALYYFASKFQIPNSKFKIVVAHDARLSSPGLYHAIIANLRSAKPCPPGRRSKAQIVKAGIATTPMFYFLAKKLKADGGIMVTASHNPKNFNGLKIVDKDAMPISGSQIFKILNSK